SDDVRGHAAPDARPRTTAAPMSMPARPAAATVPAAGDVRLPFRGVRKKIAENLVRSKHTAAHYTYVEEVDCTDLVVLRARANQLVRERGEKLSFLTFFIIATVR